MRYLDVDKQQATRGGNTYDEVPAQAKSRIIAPGFKDPDVLTGKLKTGAPTAPPEAVAWTMQMAASMNWRLHSGDIESAFLSGGPMQRESCTFVRRRRAYPQSTGDLLFPVVCCFVRRRRCAASRTHRWLGAPSMSRDCYKWDGHGRRSIRLPFCTGGMACWRAT